MRPTIVTLLLTLSLPALVLLGFGRLVLEPNALLVDPARPSVDLAFPGQARGIGNDLTSVFLPRYETVVGGRKAWRTLPTWDDSGFGGRPLVGNPQAGLFYPPVWLAWAAGRPSALGWLTVAHLMVAGAGMFVLGRRLGMSTPAAVVAAGCFEMSPYLLGHTFEGHYPHVWSVCWYPWAFWSAFEARRGGAVGTLVLPVVLALAFLTGHPQEWYYLVVTLGAWAVVEGFRTARAGDKAGAARWLLAWAGLMAVGFAACAVEWLPDAAAQSWTLRSGKIPLRRMDRYHLHALNLLQLLTPNALGGPHDYVGHENYWETVLSVGLAPLFLAVIGVTRHPRRDLTRAWLAVGVLATLFAAGRKFGVFAVAYTLLPGMDHFRVPSRTLYLAGLAASALAGFGADALLGSRLAADYQWDGTRRRVLAALGVIAAVVIVVAVADGTDRSPDASPSAVRTRDDLAANWTVAPSPAKARAGAAVRNVATDPVFWTAVGGVALAWGLAKADAAGRARLVLALGAVAFLELGLNARRLLIVSRPEAFLAGRPVIDRLRSLRDEPDGPVRFASVGNLVSDLDAARNGLAMTNVNDGFQLQHAADVYQTLYPFLDPAPMPRTDQPMDAAVIAFEKRLGRSTLDRMGVRYFVTDRPLPWDDLEPMGTSSHASPLLSSVPQPFLSTDDAGIDPRAGRPTRRALPNGRNADGVTLYRNPGAMPRAYVVPRVSIGRGDRRTLAEVDPRSAVIMPSDPLDGTPGKRQPFRPARYRAAGPARLAVQVETENPGLLVIADTWMPGWTARLDGRAVPVLRGDRCQRVVALPEAGRHEVVLEYRPPGLRAGVAVSLVAVATWGLLAVALARRRPRVAVRAGRCPSPIGGFRPSRDACGPTTRPLAAW